MNRARSFFFVCAGILSLTVPNAVLGQPADSGSLGLVPEARARLAQAAGDSRLASWQRDLMQGLARTGTTSTLGSSAVDIRAARPALVASAADGAWKQLDGPARISHSAVYDPVRDRMVGYYFPGLGYPLNDVWALSLAGTPTWTQLTPTGTPPSAR